MPQPQTQERLRCYHCGDHCPSEEIRSGEHVFCCSGCKTVYELLSEHGLCRYYSLEENPGVKLPVAQRDDAYAYLDDGAVQHRLLDFTDGRTAQIGLYLPQIHCTSCVWLLENLYKLLPGVLSSQVHFGKKRLEVSYDPRELSLRDLAATLASVGYAPDFRLDSAERDRKPAIERKLLYQIGLAGFAFGNIMLFAFPEYLDGGETMDAHFRQLFRWLNLVLVVPVFFYSGGSYLTSAWEGLRQKHINMDVPISLGMTALFGRTAYEIIAGVGSGYADSLAGFVFFLLLGKFLQQRTYASLSFDRDYKSYFPLTVLREKADGAQESVMVTELQPGDVMHIRHGELIPADAYLLSDTPGLIDYSFVTGESEPIQKRKGEYLYAGGRQQGGAIQLAVAKAVSQSSLTQLWNRSVFDKSAKREVSVLADQVGRWFTLAVLVISLGAFAFWAATEGWGPAFEVATAVLIVACPCALALSIPFTFGAAQNVMGRFKCYLKNTGVVEAMADIDTLVFDKTGTLTYGRSGEVRFQGEPLSGQEKAWVAALTRQSVHPVSRKIAAAVGGDQRPVSIRGFTESTGLGIQAEVDGHLMTLGKENWVRGEMRDGALDKDTPRGWTCLSIDGQHRGCFDVQQALRPGLDSLLERLKDRFALYLLTGDRKEGIGRLRDFFGGFHRMFFEQSPADKLDFVEGLQAQGHRVAMVGDGLNDAGALRASRLGITITDDVNSFTPASDAILDARQLERMPELLAFARYARRVVFASFGLSLLYNITGLTFAVQGLLSPVVSAIIMPVSSITVVLFATGMVEWGRRQLNR